MKTERHSNAQAFVDAYNEEYGLRFDIGSEVDTVTCGESKRCVCEDLNYSIQLMRDTVIGCFYSEKDSKHKTFRWQFEGKV
ncbi:MAG: hypothetical protein ISS36_00325 [Candidatus Aenigmarchaeota archaeon]|nr:hypothetical protein [Candidatus Aenigmarchaeota archaeon]